MYKILRPGYLPVWLDCWTSDRRTQRISAAVWIEIYTEDETGRSLHIICVGAMRVTYWFICMMIFVACDVRNRLGSAEERRKHFDGLSFASAPRSHNRKLHILLTSILWLNSISDARKFAAMHPKKYRTERSGPSRVNTIQTADEHSENPPRCHAQRLSFCSIRCLRGAWTLGWKEMPLKERFGASDLKSLVMGRSKRSAGRYVPELLFKRNRSESSRSNSPAKRTSVDRLANVMCLQSRWYETCRIRGSRTTMSEFPVRTKLNRVFRSVPSSKWTRSSSSE